MDFRADLHCHSTCSDGTFAPSEIALLAKKQGLRGLAITDHDTIEAYNTLFDDANAIGMDLISGVEFSCIHKELSVHILGYAFATTHKQLKAFCGLHKNRRTDRNRAILQRLSHEGMIITEEDLQKTATGSSIGRPHIALALVEKGYVQSVPEAFKRYIGEGQPCYAKGKGFSVEETIATIHSAGGVAIIAHPHLIKDQKTLNDLMEMPFDGLEAYYGLFQKETDEKWVQKARKKGWLITGGSDFHGTIKPNIPLGCSWTPEEMFRMLKTRFERSQYA